MDIFRALLLCGLYSSILGLALAFSPVLPQEESSLLNMRSDAVYSFNQDLRTFHEPGVVPGIGECMNEKQDLVLALIRVFSLVGKEILNKQIYTYIVTNYSQ